MAKKTRKKSMEDFAPNETASNGSTSTSQPEKVTKADAVRAALKLGIEKPQEGATFIKNKFGVDITPQVFSSYKSTLSRKEPKPGSGSKPASDSIDMGSLATVKELMDKVGGDTLKRLVDVLGK